VRVKRAEVDSERVFHDSIGLPAAIDAADEALRPGRESYVRAVALMHIAHDQRQIRANRMRRARVCVLGEPLPREMLRRLTEDAGALLVGPDQHPTLVVVGAGADEERAAKLGRGGVPIIDRIELERSLSAYNHVHRPPSLRLACAGAVERANASRMQRQLQAAEAAQADKGRGLHTREAEKRRREAAAKPAWEEIQSVFSDRDAAA
jgi:hypothetical protein